MEFLDIVKNILRFNFYLIVSYKRQQEKIVKLERITAWYENPYKHPIMKSGSNKSDPNRADVWFTFMLCSYVDPTNNWAELSVREVVRQRIMRQTLRPVEGAWIFTTLLSCMGTWRLSGANIRERLEKYMTA